MVKKMMLMATLSLAAIAVKAQKVDATNPYLVWTKNVVEDSVKTGAGQTAQKSTKQKVKDFMNQYFSYVPLCDWVEGARFMVIPDKKDMVIKTFTDATTNTMVSSMTLRHKIMIYRGHRNDGGLHDRIYFDCVENDSTTRPYFYEIPSGTFEDYCGSKFGVPTLAYLGDVDAAKKQLMGKKLLTKFNQYNVDVSTTSYGYDKVPVKVGTEVSVVAVGVGTRNFPVKIIVKDKKGNEFFQNVAISRTNSGMRDEEFEEDNVKHTFEGSFEFLGDSLSVSDEYKPYLNADVLTLYKTTMKDADGKDVEFPRLSEFKIKSIRAYSGSDYARLTLEHDGKEYTKEVTFKQESVIGDIAGEKEHFIDNLFHRGMLRGMKNVRQENIPNIQKSIVRTGYTEEEVRLALGTPDGRGSSSNGVYTWTYRSSMNANSCTVYFDTKTKKVKGIQK